MELGVREYCVHYSGWNTRYDEWISEERIASRITMNNNERIRPSTAKVRANDEHLSTLIMLWLTM